MFEKLIKEYPEFYENYKRSFMDCFMYSNYEIEGLKSEEARKNFVDRMLEAFKVAETNEGKMTPQDIIKIANIVNKEKGIEGFRKINVYPGCEATFNPVPPQMIYMAMYDLINNYYNVWTDLDPYLREAYFHINFMRIHPFEDGNKRTSKILLIVHLLKSSLAPVAITELDTTRYYNYINNQDYTGLAEFFKERSKIEMNHIVSMFKLENGIDLYVTPEVFKEGPTR